MSVFPKNFLWGASTSAYQVEGSFDKDGKGLSVMDQNKPNPGRCDFSVASNHYEQYQEDIKLMAEMGFKAYRMSISWTRILPNGDDLVPNSLGIEHYKNVFKECKKYGIEPVVTMFHFDFPLALVEKYGGWTNREMIDVYLNYAKVLFENFKDDVKYWLTYNEQNMVIFFGAFDIMGGTRRMKSEEELYNEAHIQLLAQAKAMSLCHEMCPNALIGPAPNIACCYPKTSSPKDYIAQMNYNDVKNYMYLDALVHGEYPKSMINYLKNNNSKIEILDGDMDIFKNAKPDFIAFNYYGGTTVEHMDSSEIIDKSALATMRSDDISFLALLMSKPGLGKAVSNDHINKTSYGMSIDPVGLRVTLRELHNRYHLPLIITENGCGVHDTLLDNGRVHDDYRIDYLSKHIEQCGLAIEDGVELFGYCPWSAIDLVSTREGCSKRYGFIYVNRDEFDLKDLKRYKKDSFYWYKKVIKSNGEDLSTSFEVE